MRLSNIEVVGLKVLGLSFWGLRVMNQFMVHLKKEKKEWIQKSLNLSHWMVKIDQPNEELKFSLILFS